MGDGLPKHSRKNRQNPVNRNRSGSDGAAQVAADKIEERFQEKEARRQS